jgi:hypothetical protein
MIIHSACLGRCRLYFRVNHQTAVLAYPINPVLLICLGLTVVSYPEWIRWTAALWRWEAPHKEEFISPSEAKWREKALVDCRQAL